MELLFQMGSVKFLSWIFRGIFRIFSWISGIKTAKGGENHRCQVLMLLDLPKTVRAAQAEDTVLQSCEEGYGCN